MKWEDLKVYRPLTKEELKTAFKDFTKIISDNLKHFGFQLKGRKIQRVTNDVLQTIHIDTRSSWMGIDASFKTEISISPYCNKIFIIEELYGTRRIDEIIPKIRNHYRVTQEYNLLADFITRQIIDHVLDYLDKFNSSQNIVNNNGYFSISDVGQRNQVVIIFSELKNRVNKNANTEINKILNHWNNSIGSASRHFSDYLNDLKFYKEKLSVNDWDSISKKLRDDEEQVLKMLKFKSIHNQ